MLVGFRSYILTSIALHAAILGGMALSSLGSHSRKLEPAKLTLRTNTRPTPVTSKPPRKQAAAKSKQAKIIQKVIPVMRSDAPETAIPELEDPDEPDDFAPSAETNLGAVSSADSVSGVVLEREAQLVASSLPKPEYTVEALKARLQGLFAVDIHLSDSGEVMEIEVVQSPGFGMDERIVAALRGAKYLSKRDAKGINSETWITIQFRLEIP